MRSAHMSGSTEEMSPWPNPAPEIAKGLVVKGDGSAVKDTRWQAWLPEFSPWDLGKERSDSHELASELSTLIETQACAHTQSINHSLNQ